MALFACKVGGAEGTSNPNLLGTVSFTARNQTQTIDVKNVIANYSSATVDEFFARVSNSTDAGKGKDMGGNISGYHHPVEFEYDSSTGILTVHNGWGGAAGQQYGSTYGYDIDVEVCYCKKS